MKFNRAWTLAGKPRDGTPAPPAGKQSRYCRARRRAARCSAKASASSAACSQSSAPDAASILRLANLSLAQALRTSPPSQGGATAGCHTHRRRTRQALEIYVSGSAYRTVRAGWFAGAGLGRLATTGSVLLVGGFRNWFGFFERRVATYRCRRHQMPCESEAGYTTLL